MRALVIAALFAASVASAAGLRAASSKRVRDYPDSWVDLFPPPFTNAPSIIEGLGCVSGGLCFIPAGDNGVGFQIMSFDGQFDGSFQVLQTPESSPMSIYSTLGAGGTAQQPYGLACGFGNPEARYNSSIWYTPSGLLMASSIDVRFDTITGQNVALFNALEPEQWQTSTDGGLSFSSTNVILSNITPALPNPNCMWPRYTSLGGANASVGYQTFGNWPGNSAVDSKNSRRYRVSRDATPSVPHYLLPKRVQKGLEDQNCGYNAGIIKTTDGGNTWTTVFADTTTGFYFNQIDCVDPDNCVAVAESIYNATGPSTGGRIYTTHDGGKSWALTFHQSSNATVTNTLQSVRFSVVNSKEVWAGGAQQNNGNPEGVMLKSTDGGDTWVRYETLDYIGEVLDMTFTKDGNAFASCITEFDDSTILRYNANGPAPTTPAPYSGLITQYVCGDNGCSQGCNVTKIPQQTCMGASAANNGLSGGSTQFRCSMSDDVVIELIYPLSDTCTFVAEQSFFQLNTCYDNPNGGTIMYTCGSGYATEAEVPPPAEGAAVVPPKPRRIVGNQAPMRTRDW